MNEQQQKAEPQQYVCGFLFNQDRTAVVLVRKNKPAWQAGKLNGVGGKIEQIGHRPGEQRTESPQEAMAREFSEEAGVLVLPHDWRLFRTERFGTAASNVSDAGHGAIVHFLWARNEEAFWAAHTVESEAIERHSLTFLREHTDRQQLMYNIPYLLEMALCYMDQPADNIPAP